MNRSKKAITAVILLLSVLLLSACSKESEQAYPPEASLNSNEIFVFNPFNYKLGTYDLDAMEWKEINAQGAFFQGFDWGNVYPYFVVGAQNAYKFCAGKADNASLKFNYYMDNDVQALTPFAADGNLFLYLIEEVNDETCLKRLITISDEGEAELFANLDGMNVMSGVIAGDYLYFACSCDGSDYYEVWSLDLTKDLQNRSPVLVRSDYDTFRLYQYKNKLLYIDIEKRILYNDEITINMSRKSDLVFIDDDFNILAEEYTNDDNNLEIAFTDISSGAVLGTYVDAINFTRTGSVITVYGNGYIEHLNLSNED